MLNFVTNLSSLCTSTFFFFNDTATTEIYTLSLHDALPISLPQAKGFHERELKLLEDVIARHERGQVRSEEHTSELQSPCNLVCRLLLEKKKNERTALNPRR